MKTGRLNRVAEETEKKMGLEKTPEKVSFRRCKLQI